MQQGRRILFVDREPSSFHSWSGNHLDMPQVASYLASWDLRHGVPLPCQWLRPRSQRETALLVSVEATPPPTIGFNVGHWRCCVGGGVGCQGQSGRRAGCAASRAIVPRRR